jgi:hypothetical protein
LDEKMAWVAIFSQSHTGIHPSTWIVSKKSSSRYTKVSPKFGDRISHIPAIET